MVPILKDPESAGKAVAYTVVSRKDKLGRAIWTSEWHYNRWPDGEELYFLPEDPYERMNLADNPVYKQLIVVMRKLLATKQADAASARN